MTNLNTLITTLSTSLTSRPVPTPKDLAKLAELLPLVQGALATTLMPWVDVTPNSAWRSRSDRTDEYEIRVERTAQGPVALVFGSKWGSPEAIGIHGSHSMEAAKALADVIARFKGYALVDSPPPVEAPPSTP